MGEILGADFLESQNFSGIVKGSDTTSTACTLRGT